MPVPNPVAFEIFGLDIMWYAILISGGMILATVLCCFRAPSHGFTSDQILTFLIICIPAGIIGARIYYVIFNWDWYAGDIPAMLNTRAGGLAIHGGLIGGLGAAAIMCLVKKVNVPKLLDLIAPSIALGQAIGRWGNYFNSEAHGGPTDLPWAITVEGQSVHPTFLYESIWCFLLCIFLLLIDRHRVFDGQIILLYGMLYSIERIFVEALRTDSLMIGPFKQAQVISIVILICCMLLYILCTRRSHAKGNSTSATRTKH